MLPLPHRKAYALRPHSSHSIRRIGPGSASHYEIQQQQQQESAKMNIVLSTAESEKQRSSSVT